MRLLITVLLALSSLAACGGSAMAGGYPPFGAWAYGTGVPVHSRAHLHRFHPTRPVGWYGPSWHGWGSYGNLGFSATTRIRSSAWYRPIRSHPVGFGYYHAPAFTYHWRSPFVFHPRPVVHHRYYYSYSLPVLYYQVYRPITYYPSPCAVNPIIAPLTVSTHSAPAVDSTGAGLSYPMTVQATSSSIPGRMVTLVNDKATVPADLTMESGVPDRLLDAADAILQAGGYREAAKAYAQLSLRYGSSPHLLTRRFVANVLGRDLEQAEVLVQLAGIDNLHLDAAYLHAGGLQSFLESHILIDAASEALAARALSRSQDPVALRSIAQWLELAQNHEKAAIFRLAAQRLEDRKIGEEVLGAELVSLD